MFPIIPIHIPVPQVPFYSQFQDIQSPAWQKVGCGIASLAMVVEYYKPDTISVNELLHQGIASGAYNQNAGWIHQGLISLSKKYGLVGSTHDLSKLNNKDAFSQFKKILIDGPVIASVHYKFDPKSTIPHLVVIDVIDNDIIYYNDPALKIGEQKISIADFMKGWKKRFIVIRPSTENKNILLAKK